MMYHAVKINEGHAAGSKGLQVTPIVIGLPLQVTPIVIDEGHAAGSNPIQIGLSPVYVYAGGIIIFAIFLLQTQLAQRRRQNISDLCRDLLVCYVKQRGGTVFLGEVGLAWADFVTDLAIALSVRFPNVTLFVLMWVFIGAQLLPYMALVFAIHSPSGWLVPPSSFMLELRHATGLVFMRPAAQITKQQVRDGWHSIGMLKREAWEPGRIAARLWFLAVGISGASVLVVLAILLWSLTLLCALLWAVMWALTWVVLLCVEIAFRTVLFVSGFLLYVAQLLSFPEAPMTQLFFKYWCAQVSEAQKDEMRLDQQSPALQDVPVFELSHQGVNIFRLHTTYLFEFVIESIAQLVIQILIASLGEGWSVFVIASVTFSSIIIVFFLSRYAYWLIVRPYWSGCTVRQSLIDMHLYYYHIVDELDHRDSV